MFQRSSSQLKVMIQKQDQKPVVLNATRASDFTLGKDLNCSYTIDSEAFSRRHQLIRNKGGVDFLMIPDGVPCEFVSRASKDERVSLRTLSGMGVVLKENGCFAIPFRSGTAALMKVGDITIGVEAIASSHSPLNKDQLPFELRFARPSVHDQRFFWTLSLCFLITFISVVQLQKIPPPEINEMDFLEKHYAKLVLDTPVVSREIFQFEQPQPKPEPTEEKLSSPPSPSEPERPKAKPDSRGAPQKSESSAAAGKGLLAHLNKNAGLGGMLESSALKNALGGVGVLTTKRPAGQKLAGPAFAYREASGVEEMVAGVASRSGGEGSGAGAGKTVTAVGNPFNVSGSGTTHRLRSQLEIDRVIRQHLEGIRFLYERFLRTNPSLQGRVTLKFSINPQGEVTGCDLVSSTLGNADFHSELMKRIRLWRFPTIEASGGTVSVVYPFTFLPKRD